MSGPSGAQGTALPAHGKPRLVETGRGPVELVRSETGGEGRGLAVLALHGGLGGWDQSLLLARSAFAAPDEFDILALSRPGYLGTPLAGRRTPEAQADLYAALLDRLERPTALVVAISAGGPSALAFAKRYPERCAGLVLVSACTGRLHVPRRVKARLPIFTWAARIPGVTALLGWLAARQPERAARASILDEEICRRTLVDRQAGPLMRQLQESIFVDMKRRLPGTLDDTQCFGALPAVTPAGTGVPTLVIHGTADRVVPFAHAQRLADAESGAALMAIAGGEHVCLFTHLDAVRARVAAFIADLLDTEGRWKAPGEP